MDTIGVGVLGAGYFAQFHYEAWRRINGVRVVGAADQDLVKAQETGAEAFEAVEPMLEATKPDLLDIATPPPSHAAAVRAALKAGLRWIICQKPFCTSLQEAEQVVDEAERAGATLIIHENFRFQPWYRAMRAALQADRVGPVRQMTFRLRPGDGQGPDAYLARQPYFQKMERFLVHETAVHWIDTFRFLLGQPRAVYADLRRNNPAIAGEDAGYLILHFDQGVRALFDGNRLLDHPAENPRLTMGEALLEGDLGALSLSGEGGLALRRFGEREPEFLLQPRHYAGFGGDCVHALQAHVTNAMRGSGAVENSGRDYLVVRRIAEAAYLSAKEARKVTLAPDGQVLEGSLGA
ncbi:MAG: Gfo/Idh/MocA family oxidoreductase [Pseudomonadota bacterium]